jgi:hypothetical protein
MKVKTIAHIYFCKYAWQEKGEFSLFYAKVDDTETMIYVNSQEVEIEVPDAFDPRALQIAALKKHKQKVMADYQKTVDQINDRISKLQALEYTDAAQ